MVLTSDLLDTLDQHVLDQHQLVTYLWLAREIGVSSEEAKRVLYEYSNTRSKIVQANFVVTGLQNIENDFRRSVILVPSEKLDETRAKFSKVFSIHVYSVQDHEPRDLRDIYSVTHKQAEKTLKSDGLRSFLGDNRSSNLKFKVDLSSKPSLKATSTLLSTTAAIGPTPPNTIKTKIEDKPVQVQDLKEMKADIAPHKPDTTPIKTNPVESAPKAGKVHGFFSQTSKKESTNSQIRAAASEKELETSKPIEKKQTTAQWFSRSNTSDSQSMDVDKTNGDAKEALRSSANNPASTEISQATPKRKVKRIIDDDEEIDVETINATPSSNTAPSQASVIPATQDLEQKKSASEEIQPESQKSKRSTETTTTKTKAQKVKLVLDQDNEDEIENADSDFERNFEPPRKLSKKAKPSQQSKSAGEDAEPEPQTQKKKTTSPKKTSSKKGQKAEVVFRDEGEQEEEESDKHANLLEKQKEKKGTPQENKRNANTLSSSKSTLSNMSTLDVHLGKEHDLPATGRMKAVTVTETVVDERGYKVRRQVTKMVEDETPQPDVHQKKESEMAADTKEAKPSAKAKVEAAKKPATTTKPGAQSSIMSFFGKK
eukprot:TRINITY_DN10067_c0_g1_i1.p1 TRINITY_DN10067_c0_g1~~TRINITY_DN10067_c0_g1_i1.p1  ORF type:complete len:599 (-),score=156.81 TRINITY_DN10067_c0_g1_i1:221-2017(-)